MKNHDEPDLIKSFTDILGSLMQGTDGPIVDYLKRKDYPSTISLNALTVNHGNLTRNPKLDNRELKQCPIKHRPLIMQMAQNSANILCINEADPFHYPKNEKTTIDKLFIKCGYKGIVLKLWSPKSIACFVRGGKRLAPYISTKSQLLHSACSDASSDSWKVALI